MRYASTKLALSVAALLLAAAIPHVCRADTMEAKADAILIPHLDLEDVTVEEVFALLRTRSKELDPDHRGVNFVFKFSPAGKTIFSERRVSMMLDRITLSDVIRYTCMASGLKCLYEENAVVIYDAGQAPTGMNTKAYNVKPGVFNSRRTRKKAEDIDTDDDD